MVICVTTISFVILINMVIYLTSLGRSDDAQEIKLFTLVWAAVMVGWYAVFIFIARKKYIKEKRLNKEWEEAGKKFNPMTEYGIKRQVFRYYKKYTDEMIDLLNDLLKGHLDFNDPKDGSYTLVVRGVESEHIELICSLPNETDPNEFCIFPFPNSLEFKEFQEGKLLEVIDYFRQKEKNGS